MQLARRIALVAAVGACACKGDRPPAPEIFECPPDAGFIGDPDASPELEVGVLSPDGTFTPIEQDGASVDLFTPPQGGKLILAGTRIANMGACATVVGRLRDPTTEGEPVTVREGRDIRFEPIPDRPGWAAPRRTGTTMEAITDEGPNMLACLNFGDRDIDGCEWIYVVSVEDDAGRYVERRVRIMPGCPEDDPACPGPGCEESDEDAHARCECECAANGYEGKCDDLTPWRKRPAPMCTAE